MRLLVFLVWSQSVPHFKLHNIDQQQNILTNDLKNCIIVGFFFFYSIFDLQMSNPDPLLPSLLERTPADELDLANQEERQLHRMHSLFSIYPIQQVSRENRSLLLIVIGSVVKGRILRKLTMFIVEVNLEP